MNARDARIERTPAAEIRGPVVSARITITVEPVGTRDREANPSRTGVTPLLEPCIPDMTMSTHPAARTAMESRNEDMRGIPQTDSPRSRTYLNERETPHPEDW